MASQTVSDCCCEVSSFIRELHVYKDVWTPTLGEVLLLRTEPENAHDKYTVAVVKPEGNSTVGYILYNLAPIVSSFLSRGFNKGMLEVTGERVNRGAGYGLEVPCRAQQEIHNMQCDLLVPSLTQSQQ